LNWTAVGLTRPSSKTQQQALDARMAAKAASYGLKSGHDSKGASL
jgi:hypothetical protein